MSDVSALTELAGFVAKSPLASDNRQVRRLIGEVVNHTETAVSARKSTDLLGAVLALSARTRRVIQPHVGIDLDVFAPNGRRAARLHMS